MNNPIVVKVLLDENGDYAGVELSQGANRIAFNTVARLPGSPPDSTNWWELCRIVDKTVKRYGGKLPEGGTAEYAPSSTWSLGKMGDVFKDGSDSSESLDIVE